ncbi:hypothetical protein BV898_02607 [Hypsibius exemplaris]|uniref:Uncharacterized protein n=1 Tax=Hypsibius exemplaris TaxID=2072580 RepID=A0A1W0X7Y4_HYPEX|nr:hypothetical protein BV898_02607 [Hypsibius exemplaris]
MEARKRPHDNAQLESWLPVAMALYCSSRSVFSAKPTESDSQTLGVSVFDRASCLNRVSSYFLCLRSQRGGGRHSITHFSIHNLVLAECHQGHSGSDQQRQQETPGHHTRGRRVIPTISRSNIYNSPPTVRENDRAPLPDVELLRSREP